MTEKWTRVGIRDKVEPSKEIRFILPSQGDDVDIIVREKGRSDRLYRVDYLDILGVAEEVRSHYTNKN